MKTWNYSQPVFEYEEIRKDWDTPWSGHKYFGYDLVKNLIPRTIVELGTAGGTSMFSFAQAAKDSRIVVKIHAVDTWKGDEHTGDYSEKVYIRVKQIIESTYSMVNIQLMRMLFDDARDTFEDGSVDLLHIDGLHTYDAVKHDFNTWLPKMSETGVIIFHDISERKDDFGVYQFWDELKNEFGTMEFGHSHGLGVLFCSKTMFEEYKNLENQWNVWYLQQVYQSTKAELYQTKKLAQELAEIKSSKFFAMKENLKKVLGK